MKPRICITILALLSVPVADAGASFITFTDRSSFEISVPGLSEEDFSSSFSSTPSLVLPGVTIAESSANPLLMRSVNGTDGNGGFFYISDGPSSITFSFASPINAFGIDVVDFGTVVGAGNLIYSDNSGDVPSHLVASAPLLSGNYLFFGILNPDSPFTQVTLTSTTTDESVFLDRLSFGAVAAVPEPSAVTLFGLGGLALLTYARKQQKRRR